MENKKYDTAFRIINDHQPEIDSDTIRLDIKYKESQKFVALLAIHRNGIVSSDSLVMPKGFSGCSAMVCKDDLIKSLRSLADDLERILK